MATIAAANMPSVASRRWILILLAVINTVNFIDRQVITILAEPLRLELGLTDWHIGMLTGLAFALLYTTMGLPLARVADRGSRTALISWSLTAWSVCTAAGALVTNFTQLLLARIGVGIGEAGCTPAAHSLISDITPPEKRASAIAIYALGVPLGSLIGLALGGMAANELGWRMTFVLAGAPGLLLAVIIRLVPEPRHKAAIAPTVPMADAMREFLGKPAFRWLCGGAAIASFVYYGQSAFYGAFFLRSHGAEVTQLAADLGLKGALSLVGIGLGCAIGIGGCIGVWAGGYFAERWLQRDPGAYAAVPGTSTLLSAPFFLGAVLVDSFVPAIACVFIAIVFQSMTYGPMFAGAQNLVRPETRAMVAAVLLFVISAIGLGFGPLTIGIISDLLHASQSTESLRWAMAICAATMLTSPLLYFRARKTFHQDEYRSTADHGAHAG